MESTDSYARAQQESLAGRVNELRATLASRDPKVLAENTGMVYAPTSDAAGTFSLAVLGVQMRCTFPDFVVTNAATGAVENPAVQALVAYYALTADGTRPSGEWVAFQDMPDGMFYHQAFQGYTGNELVRAFGNDRDAFKHAAEALGGAPLSLGDAAYSFMILPYVPVAVIYWQGDDECDPAAKLLFDAAIPHHLPSDVCAIFGKILVGKLMRLKA